MADPDTVMVGSSGALIYRNTAAYGAGAMATDAGDLTLRIYTDTGVGNQIVVLVDDSVTPFVANQFYKVEIASNGATDPVLTVYLDGGQKGSPVTATGAATAGLGAVFGLLTASALARQMFVDCFYVEHARTTAR